MSEQTDDIGSLRMAIEASEQHRIRDNKWLLKRAKDAEERVCELEATLVEAVVPLEVIAGQHRVKPYKELSPGLMQQMMDSIKMIRQTLSSTEHKT